MGKGNPALISNNINPKFIQYPKLWLKNPIWFCKFAKKVAVIAADAMGKWNQFSNILSFFQYLKRQI